MNAMSLSGNQEKIILIIDDTPANVAMLAEYLERQHFQVLVAQDGEEGLERASLAQPNLILMDVMMSGMNGFEACRRLKAMESTKNIPVIFMTALTSTEDKLTGFDVGGADYVTKPIQIKEVAARVNTHLNLHAMQIDQQKQMEELKEINKKLEQAQMQLLQSEKMASIGQLAAGVAHEINNPIGFVYSNLGMLEQYVMSMLKALEKYVSIDEQRIAEPDIVDLMKQIRNETDIDYLKNDLPALMRESREGITRVKEIVQNLKNFSHVSSRDEWRLADLHAGLDSTINIAVNEFKYKAQLKKEYGNIPEIECLAPKLNQVFLNMLVNASHAIEANGIITVRTRQDGEFAIVEISDTGCGIPPEILKNIFDPFFTTKPIGKGTGLGLSLSYSIIEEHRGHIDVLSEVGKGTTFRIKLPIWQSAGL